MKPFDAQLQPSGKILIVDDAHYNLDLLSSTLADEGYDVRCAENGRMALMWVQHDKPDLILLDIRMPDLSGYEVCQQLQADPSTNHIPIIFLSASNEVEEKLQAFEMGGIDYITKPFEIAEVLARVKTQMGLLSAKADIIQLNAELESRVLQRTSELEALNQALEQEIQERCKAEDQLIYDALHDALTDLPNRNLLIDRLDQALRLIKRYPSKKFAVLFLDLDRFKLINDSLGHLVGDQLLVCFAQLLSESVRESDTVARLGGDEFTILLEEIDDINGAIQVANRIQSQVQIVLPSINPKFCTSASIGIVMGNPDYNDASELLRDADLAMYQAKEQGKARYAVFDNELHEQSLRRLDLESRLRTAIQDQEFVLYYQPILTLETQQVIGFESLIRWQDSRQGIISPGEFIPIAEESGLIVPIGEWVLRESCFQLKQWQETLPNAADLTMSVNLSLQQFQNEALIQTIDSILLETKLDPKSLKLEITESVLMKNTNSVINTLASMSQRGIKICMDDFGTGYSSLSYLHRFPVDVLKIDRSFVGQMGHDGENYEIIRTIIALGHTLGLQIVAEGIELKEQAKELAKLGCEFGQGYLFAKPLNSQSAQELIRSEATALIDV